MNTNHLTLLARITNRLTAIKELPIAQLELRQPMLVDVLVNLVDVHTNMGRDTNTDWGVTAQPYWQILKEMAGDAGFMFLGAGHFSAAFKHEMLPGKVIKIGFKKEDSGAAYAAFCRANPNTVGLPIIHALERHTSCYSVVLDELQEFPRRGATPHQNKQYDIARDVIDYDSKVWRSEDEYEQLNEFERNLLVTAEKIRAFFYGVGSFDCHRGNVMLDRWGRLVITDPVSYTANKLEAVEFEALCCEIEAHKLEQKKEYWLMRHRRNHPCETEKLRLKVRRKNRRKAAKKKRKALAEFDKINLSELESVAAVHGLSDDQYLKEISAAIEAAPKGPERQALKAARMGMLYGAPRIDFARPNQVLQLWHDEMIIHAPREPQVRLNPAAFKVSTAILADAAINADLREQAVNKLIDGMLRG